MPNIWATLGRYFLSLGPYKKAQSGHTANASVIKGLQTLITTLAKYLKTKIIFGCDPHPNTLCLIVFMLQLYDVTVSDTTVNHGKKYSIVCKQLCELPATGL